MSRTVRITLLCEDVQHRVFALRYLEKMGWSKRHFYPVTAPGGRGAAEQFVRTQFPMLLKRHRTKHGNVSLFVLIDGDRHGVDERLAQLDEACDQARVPRRQANESVFIFVPTWSIETWLTYLDGESVLEDKGNYPRLQREKDCKRHLEVLVDMCHAGQIREPAPSSLTAACVEYKRFFEQTPTK